MFIYAEYIFTYTTHAYVAGWCGQNSFRSRVSYTVTDPLIIFPPPRHTSQFSPLTFALWPFFSPSLPLALLVLYF